MNSLHALNLAVNLLVAGSLLLAWRHDREQRYSRQLGLAFLVLSLSGPGVPLWLDADRIAHAAGTLLVVVSITGYLTLLIGGIGELSGKRISRRSLLVVMLVLVVTQTLALSYNPQLAQAEVAVQASIVSVVVTYWLWGRGTAERVAGLLFVLIALNQLQFVVGGVARIDAQIATGCALRLAVGLALLYAAYTRSSRQALRLHERFLQLTERSHQGVVVMRGEQVLYANPAALSIYGVDSVATPGDRWLEATIAEAERSAARERHRAVLAGELEQVAWEGERQRVDGTPIQLRFSAWRIDWDGAPAEQIVVTDATAEQNALRDLLHQATHDTLTGAPNRSALLQRLQALSRDGTRFALIVLDIDRFALFNGAHGPSVGDQVLVALSQALTQALAGQADVMRLGEDEFALLSCDPDPDSAAARVAATVRRLLTTPLVLPQHEFFLDVSMGIALHPATAREPEALLRAANAAMYAAKRIPGTSQQRAESRFEHGSGQSLQAEQALRAGLERQQFHLVYQPKVDAVTRATVGFEALVRWQRDGQVIAPSEFIPAAENTGLILALGRHILTLAVAQLAAWRASGMPWLPVAVNVSPLQLLDAGFPDVVKRTLAAHAVPPSALTLEITETAAVTHMEQARGQITVLREHGIEVALDDFGVGFSSLNMLRSLPLHAVKIDRSLIEPLPAPGALAVVRTVCDLAAQLHLKVVAEGVETEAQAIAARDAGCDQLQGYLFSRPQLPADTANWLAACHAAATLRDG